MWSGKATDILRTAGYEQVIRIERGRLVEVSGSSGYTEIAFDSILFDRMMERQCAPDHDTRDIFNSDIDEPHSKRGRPLIHINGKDALTRANRTLGLALSPNELSFLEEYNAEVGRPFTDAELMMFAQVNSEHCRHKTFNARWEIDNKEMPESLFDMIRNTYRCAPENILTAYEDNAAVLHGATCSRWQADAATGEYREVSEPSFISIKAETHNHPTAISPFPGAATGVGGEIRDEVATGRGGRTKAGLCGYTVSHLHLCEYCEFPEGFDAPWASWETQPPSIYDREKSLIATPFEIMLKAPLGAAAFGNEFGRPCLAGYFRTFERQTDKGHFGYDKPIMLAGGFGTLRSAHTEKRGFDTGAMIVVLGGPAMLIGLGGGTGSSQSGAMEQPDYASVQRGNPEMQRRCQEVIEHCVALGDANPIDSIHDVGAGGLSNAIPELLHDAGCGGVLDLRRIPSADSGLSPMEIWCNESQERYVLAITGEAALETLMRVCQRERCPVAVVGYASNDGLLKLNDSDKRKQGEESAATVINLPLNVLFKPASPKHITVTRDTRHEETSATIMPLKVTPGKPVKIDWREAAYRVLSLPAVAAKGFLITIGDRTVGGMTARDQLVGPWQVPVADCAVCAADYTGYAGEAMAIGERTPVAMSDVRASARLAVCEAITNIMAADIAALADIKLSANWMASCGDGAADREHELYKAVYEVGEVLCPALGIAIPVGKDSLSMRMKRLPTDETAVVSPLSLIVSAFAPVSDIRKTRTPELKKHSNTDIYLIDLSDKKNRLGESSLAQCYRVEFEDCANLDDPRKLVALFEVMRELRQRELILSAHDRSDGGLWATVCEMAFTARCGLDLDLGDENSPNSPNSPGGNMKSNGAPDDGLSGVLFAEEPGMVIQIQCRHRELLEQICRKHGLGDALHRIGRPVFANASNSESEAEKAITVRHGNSVHRFALDQLLESWWKVDYGMRLARDNPECVRREYRQLTDANAKGLSAHLTFSPRPPQKRSHARRADVAILREQGTNGHMEMAAAFARVGFRATDVHMNDLLQGRVTLEPYHGLAICGGFSFGDVFGAGRGWAASVRYHADLRKQFEHYFSRADTFTLGVCNGCQMLAELKELVPGAGHWPIFGRNNSEQFEARLSLVSVEDTPSILLRGMAGSKIPVVVSHGEGRAVFPAEKAHRVCEEQVCLRYIDNNGCVTEHYPANPNGSPNGIAGLCNTDGRVTVMMPHPERLFRNEQFSWRDDWGDISPWLQLFDNAYRWVTEG